MLPSGEGVWALPPSDSDGAGKELEALPEWGAAQQALKGGKPAAAVAALSRVVDVTAGMGLASPMAVAAQKEYVHTHNTASFPAMPSFPQDGAGRLCCC